MDRISDSGSEGCGSIPHGGTKIAGHFGRLFLLYVRNKYSDNTEHRDDI